MTSLFCIWPQVLYIPDQDEIARSAPKSAPPQLQLPSSDQMLSSVESEGTIRSSSVSQPLPDPDPSTVPQGGEVAEGGESPVLPYNRDGEYFEEVTENHMVLISRYISDDQVSVFVRGEGGYGGLRRPWAWGGWSWG